MRMDLTGRRSADASDDAVIELLTSQGKLDDGGVQRAKRLQSGGGEHLHSLLVKLGVVSEETSRQLLPSAGAAAGDAAGFLHQPLLDGALSSKFLKDSRILPIADGGDAIVLAMADPLDDFAVRGRDRDRKAGGATDRYAGRNREGAGAALWPQR